MRVAIFLSSIMFVIVAVAALPMSAPAEADTTGAAHARDAYGR